MSGLSSLLVRDQIVGVRRIEEALQRQVIHGGDLETNLLELGAAQEDVLAHYRAQVEGLQPVTAWEVMNPDAGAVRLLTAELAGRHRLLPLRIEGMTLLVAVAEVPPASTLDELSFLLSLDVVPRITTELRLAVALGRVYEVAVPPRLQRLAERLGPTAAPGVVAAHVVSVAGSGALRRSSAPPPPARRIATPAPAAPVPAGPEPVRPSSLPQESLAEGVIALVDDERPSRPAAPEERVVETTRTPRSDETERVFVPSRTGAAPARRRRTLTPGIVAELLAAAGSRDEVLDLLLQVAHQALEYVAVFVVHDDAADGRQSIGPGTDTEALRLVSIPLSAPGVLRNVRVSGNHYLGPVPQEEQNRALLEGLGRATPANLLVLPVSVRSRVVLLFVGDNGRRPTSAEEIGGLLVSAPRAGAALERLIVSRKFSGPEPAPAGGRRRVTTPVPSERVRSEPALPSPAVVLESIEPTQQLSVPEEAPVAPAPPVAPPPKPPVTTGPLVPLGPPTTRVAVPPAIAPEPPVARTSDSDGSPGAWTALGSGGPDMAEVAPPRAPAAPVPVAPLPAAELARATDIPFRDTMPSPPRQVVQPPELGPVSGQTSGRRRSVSEPYRVDVVSLPAEPAAEPSVIVDMGPNVESLVESMLRGGEEGDLAAAALQKIGEVALPSLVQRFPGPLLFDRHAAHTRLPRVADCGPLLRILPTFRRIAVPYLLPLLSARDPEVRFYATFLFSELQYPEAIARLAPVLFDQDHQIRILCIDVLKGFRRFSEFEHVTRELRETAWSTHNPSSRRRIAVEAIGELRDAAAVAMLIEMIDVPDVELSDLCWKALVLITRQDFGKAKKKWQAWLEREGARHHVEWLIDALIHPSPELRLGASEELKRITKEYFGYYYNLPKRDRERARKRYLEWWEKVGRSRFIGRS